uniref:Complexin 4c n=1 Tax=Oryzias latipes TaxID=8090 RepID=A0A3P9H4U4_ORYLA
MAFFMNQMLSSKLKTFSGGGAEGDGGAAGNGKETAESTGMSREEFDEYQRQLVEEIERDKDFATKKAERANLRVALRDKYRLPESAPDTATVQMAGEDIDLPEDLAKMVDEDEEEEESNESFLNQLQSMDLDALKTKAQSTMTEMRQTAEEKCSIM